tara:strand:- start:537 stop:698 length:162 start_codon:yes stop_codon:yes gene_type:complete
MLGLGNSITSSTTTQTAAQEQASALRARVIADGGNFEANTCLEAQLTILSNIE